MFSKKDIHYKTRGCCEGKLYKSFGWIIYPTVNNTMKMKNVTLFCLLCLLAAILDISNISYGAPSFPVTVIDDLGRTVTITTQPQRIVCISPSVTEIVYALGLGDKVVGVDIYSDYPPEAVSKQRIGNIENPDPEEVAALNPDLVVMYSFYGKGDPSVEAIEEFGFPIIAICPGTFENILRDIELIGNSTGKFSEAKGLVSSLKERMEYISNLTSNVTYRPRVYFEFWYSPPTTAGPGSWPHSLIEIAGGTNIFGDAPTKWVSTNDEEVVQKAPEVIISIRGMPGYFETLETMKRRPGWNLISAIKNEKVYFLDESLVARPGPGLFDGLEVMLTLLHSELFNAATIKTVSLNTTELKTSSQVVNIQAPTKTEIEVLKAAGNGSLIVMMTFMGPKLPENLKLVGNYLEIRCSVPTGLIFTLKINYDESDLNLLGIDESSLKIYYFDMENGEWFPLETFVNRNEDYAKAVVTHLTYFALAGEPKPSIWESPTPLWLALIAVVVISLITSIITYMALKKRDFRKRAFK